MCSACSQQGAAQHCDDCRARAGSAFPFSRTSYTLEGLISFAWARWKEHWQVLTLAALCSFVITYGVAFLVMFASGAAALLSSKHGPTTTSQGLLQVAAQIGQVLLQLWLQLGLIVLCIDVLEGRPASFETLFSRIKRIPTALGAMLLTYLGVLGVLIPFAALFLVDSTALRVKLGFGLAALVIVPIVWIALSLVFTMMEAANAPEVNALSAIRRAFALIDGHRWHTFVMIVVSFVTMLAGAIACCVGMIPAMSLATMLMCSLYLALRNPTAAS